MDVQLVGRRALVTGASTGIGPAVARGLAREGVRLVITARDKRVLDQLSGEIAAAGHGKPAVVPADMTVPDDLARLCAEAHATLGTIDILVNCAGGSRPTVIEAGDDVWDEAMTLNFTAVRRLTHAVLPGMRVQRWGRIISMSGSMEPRGLNAATAAKAALHLWSKGLSCDLAPEGITVNCIAPGRINSVQILQRMYPTPESRRDFIAKNIPAGEFGEPEDVAHLAVFLASPLARYITGDVIGVDGGMHYFGH